MLREGGVAYCSLPIFLLSLLTHFQRTLRAARATIWGHKINHSYDPLHRSSHDSHTGRHRHSVSEGEWEDKGEGTRGRRCVTCLTICTPRLGHIPFQIVVIEGIAMWQIPKYPVSISVRCVAFSFFLSLSPLSSAQLDLA